MSLPPIVECVPNFSEGRDRAMIDAIVAEMAAVEGVTVLDVDPGAATNRTVVTLVGGPEAVSEAAFRGIAAAQQRIDMRRHKGAHPRIGATDVCPFVPVRGIDMAACAELARQLGARVGAELGIPVYLYEAAASSPARSSGADIRAGEVEALEEKLGGALLPDFGPTAFTEAVARSGATVIGARPFLIAWNVNLNTKNVKKAMKVGAIVREKGIARRDAHNKAIRDEAGELVRDPGMFKHVKAIGWYIDEYARCQVSINFTNHLETPIHQVVDAVRRVADQEGVVATGSELVGLIPLDAMLAAGRHYLRRQGVNPGAPEAELVEAAVLGLGLRDLGPFDPDARIIERRIAADGVLVGLTVRGFTDALASNAPAPGGGSVAALCGALSAGLSAMVGQLTTGKEGYEAQFGAQDDNAVRAQGLREAFLYDIDADTLAFDAIMAAFKLPKGSDAEKLARRKAIRAATLGAIDVPMAVLERCGEAIDCAEVALRGNKNARSDAGVALLTARAAAEAAWCNVVINLEGIKDPEIRRSTLARADAAFARVRARVEAGSAAVRAELRGALGPEYAATDG